MIIKKIASYCHKSLLKRGCPAIKSYRELRVWWNHPKYAFLLNFDGILELAREGFASLKLREGGGLLRKP
jgi:hypothetical protein